jgi:diguanylate cyclase (GGDEF)-like protein
MRMMIQLTANHKTDSQHLKLMELRPDPRTQKPFNPAAKGIELLQKLQTSLDIEEIISLFSSHILDILPHEGYRFDESEMAISFLEGRQSRHKIAYNLSIEEEKLGTLTFYRNWKFKDKELERLEQVLTQLLYPLRNGLRYQQALEYAYYDRLTGLRNRTSMELEVPRTLETAQRTGTPLSMMMIDIDHFKRINDMHGHLCGDQILKQVGEVVSDTVRASDLAFRFGGEEIAVMLPNADEEGAHHLAERLRQEINNLCYCDERELNVTVSIGISTLRTEDDVTSLFDRADKALYEAKQTGRDRVCIG